MTTINSLLRKYQRIEAEFFTKEISEFKAEMEKFRTEIIQSASLLSAMNDKGQNTLAIKILNDLVGSA